MTGVERIRDLLRRAARDGRLDPGTPATPQAALARIAEAVDAAVLARRLDIQLGGTRLVCALAARRLVSFEAPAPDDLPADLVADLPDGATALFGRTLAAEDAGAVATLLTGLAARGGAFSLVVQAPDAGPDAAFGGIAAATLAAALGAEVAPGAADPLAAGLAALGDRLVAAVLLDGDELALCADDPATEALADRAGGLFDRLLVPDFPLLSTLETAGALTFAMPGGDRHLLLGGHLGRFVLAEIAGPDTVETLVRWRSVALI